MNHNYNKKGNFIYSHYDKTNPSNNMLRIVLLSILVLALLMSSYSSSSNLLLFSSSSSSSSSSSAHASTYIPTLEYNTDNEIPSIINDPTLKVEEVVRGLDLPTTMAFLGPNDI
ncbi:MAG: hypothetical protein M3250_00015, partial [Thermoproteota archaeon]|nr:hypothetical protein [Thermoproteota archaeon]